MRTLYLECNMGAAGDMLTGALLELTPDREEAVEKLNHLGLPGVSVKAVPSSKCGILGTHMEVTVDGEEEESLDVHEHEHEHDHEHEHHHDEEEAGHHHHHHHHVTPDGISKIVDSMVLPEEVKTDIRNVYRMIAEAEGHAHRMPVDQIHFHEVGTLDAVMDVTAVCLLMHELHPDAVIASPVRTGFGEVRCAHGILPVPAPATAYLLQGIPTYSGQIEGEMCTPTGAALLKYFVQTFEQRPEMTVEKIGYGMGNKDFPAANCVRAYLGETGEKEETEASADRDQILELRCNLDDMTGEELGYAAEKLMKAGARDVFTTPIGMKKNRPGILLTVICSPKDRDLMIHEIFANTTTLGIRETVCRRSVLTREEKSVWTEYGEVRIKTSSGYGVTRAKAEYDDLAAIAQASGKSFKEAEDLAGAAARKKES